MNVTITFPSLCNKNTGKVISMIIYILIRYWVVLSVRPSVCPCAIETTFSLSNFQTKHICGIIMALRKL